MEKPKTNRHHIWFPDKAYKTPLERAFRERRCCIIVMDLVTHNKMHKHLEPPRKPSVDFMEAEVQRCANGGCAVCG